MYFIFRDANYQLQYIHNYKEINLQLQDKYGVLKQIKQLEKVTIFFFINIALINSLFYF